MLLWLLLHDLAERWTRRRTQFRVGKTVPLLADEERSVAINVAIELAHRRALPPSVRRQPIVRLLAEAQLWRRAEPSRAAGREFFAGWSIALAMRLSGPWPMPTVQPARKRRRSVRPLPMSRRRGALPARTRATMRRTKSRAPQAADPSRRMTATLPRAGARAERNGVRLNRLREAVAERASLPACRTLRSAGPEAGSAMRLSPLF